MHFPSTIIGQVVLISALIYSVFTASAVTFCPYGSTCTLDCLPPAEVGRINSKKTVWNDRPPYVTDDGAKVIVDRKLDNDIDLNQDFLKNPDLAMNLTPELVFGNTTHIAEWASRRNEVTVDEDDLDVYWQRENLRKTILTDVKYGRLQTGSDIKENIKVVPFLLWSNGSLTILPTNLYTRDQFRFYYCRNRTDHALLSKHVIERVPGIIRHHEDPSRPRGANSVEMRPTESASLSCYIKTWGHDQDMYHILWRKNGQVFVTIKMKKDSDGFAMLPSDFEEVCSPNKSRCVEARVTEISRVENFNRVDSDIIKAEIVFSNPQKQDTGNYSCVVSYENEQIWQSNREMVAEEGGVVTFFDSLSSAAATVTTPNPKDISSGVTTVTSHYGSPKCAEWREKIDRLRAAAKREGSLLVVPEFEGDNDEKNMCRKMVGINTLPTAETLSKSPSAGQGDGSLNDEPKAETMSTSANQGYLRGKVVMILLLASIGLVVVALTGLAVFWIVYPKYWPFFRRIATPSAPVQPLPKPDKMEFPVFPPALRFENELC